MSLPMEFPHYSRTCVVVPWLLDLLLAIYETVCIDLVFANTRSDSRLVYYVETIFDL